MSNINDFKKDLEGLINKHSLENLSDTPDFMLAQYLVDCLITYGNSVKKRDNWYGLKGLSDRSIEAVNETISTSPLRCLVCGKDVSFYAGVCPNFHKQFGVE